ncbi:MAG: SWIM zinc finger family protein [Bacteroidota bacterium]
MKLSDFNLLLPQPILTRGRDYYENGLVKKLAEKASSNYVMYSAAVKGSDTYKVQLQIDQATDEIVFHRCTCPFDGGICKHVAAVLFAIMETPFGDSVSDTDSQKKKGDMVENILRELSEAETKQYLRELMEERRDLRKHFTASFISKIASDKNDYKKIIDQSIQGTRGANSFRNPSGVFRVMEPVHKFLEQAESHLHTGQHNKAFEITQAVLEKLIPALQYVDDSNGWVGDCINEAVHLQWLLADVSEDKPLRKEMFSWFLKAASHKKFLGWDCSWDFAKLAAITAPSAGAEQRIVAMTESIARNSTHGSEPIEKYEIEQSAEVMLAFYQTHKSEKDVESFMAENIELANIRALTVNRLVQQDKFQDAITLCREGVQLSTKAKLPGEVNSWYAKMLDIYSKTNDLSGIIECAEYLFLNSNLELKYYQKLKSTVPATQWRDYQPNLLALYRRHYKWHELATIYAEENRLEDVMDIMRLARYIPLMREFQSYLLPKYSLTVQQLYFDVISENLAQHATRNHYHEAVKILKEMKAHFDITGIQLFVIDLSEKYRHRPALLDELKKIG